MGNDVSRDGHGGTLRVVVVGAGFAGLNAAKKLARVDSIHLTIIDSKNHHLFQPLLYQVSLAELNTADIAFPIRSFFRGRGNVEVLMGEVFAVDPAVRRLETSTGELTYDYLLLATGTRHTYFGHDEWEAHAPGLKTLEQATEIRRRVLLAFERAECCAKPEEREEFLTFVVVGGGPTGVELAGAIAEMAHKVLPKEYSSINTRTARIILVEGGDSILSGFDTPLIERASRDLVSLGVEIRTRSRVTDVRENGVIASDQWIPAHTVLWAAGVAPSPLGRQLGAPLDRAGRVRVAADLSVPEHPEVFVAGDLAYFEQNGKPLPGVAPVALQQGKFIGDLIRREVAGKTRRTFRYRDKGSMATIGRNKAVARVGRLRLKGYLAWLSWVFVHIYYLSGFRNRLFVMMQWAWAYFTLRRSMRIIIEKDWRFYDDPPGDQRRERGAQDTTRPS